ncbi:hypothetical protein F5X68DRAFT_277186 [Plectosphaerella plurivora]|uniref:Uncharacterized protein n=1 Tax=Plectosphaerella plurivora TaxID=936078 RepID=A0A9P8V945_9PEZI|nr:hypothetical protein F5X68DRAFT_277186 [Plectosphaerella plurivora]
MPSLLYLDGPSPQLSSDTTTANTATNTTTSASSPSLSPDTSALAPIMTLPSFDLGYSSDDDAATVTSLESTSTDPGHDSFFPPPKRATTTPAALPRPSPSPSPSPSPRVRSLSDISREPTPLERSARISSWLSGLTPPRDLSALRRPSATQIPTTTIPPPDTSYLLSDSSSASVSNEDSLPRRNSALPSEEVTPATSIYGTTSKLPSPRRQRPHFVRRDPLASKKRTGKTTLTILGPAFAPRMPRPGTPEFALLFFALLACAVASPRALFIFTFAYCWGRLSERAFCGAQREADEILDADDEGVRLGRRMAQIMG